MLEDVLEIAQLLACENLEEIENFLREQGYVTNEFAAAPNPNLVGMSDGIKRYLSMDDIADYLLVRDDLGLTEAKINHFLADLSR